MKLDKSITLQAYPSKDKDGKIITPQPIVLNELDISYIYRPKSKMVYAQILNVPGFISLVENKDIDYIRQLNIANLEDLLKMFLGDDPQAALQSKFPRTLESDPDGPGSILSNMFSFLGIQSTPNCSCKRHAIEMNTNGADWCEQNMDTIIGWLREESKKRNLPFIESVAKMIVNRAIKVSRKLKKNKEKQTTL